MRHELLEDVEGIVKMKGSIEEVFGEARITAIGRVTGVAVTIRQARSTQLIVFATFLFCKEKLILVLRRAQRLTVRKNFVSFGDQFEFLFGLSFIRQVLVRMPLDTNEIEALLKANQLPSRLNDDI